MLRGSLLARFCAMTVVIVFAAAASVAGMPTRCLHEQHCGACNEEAAPGIGLGGCAQMAPATPASPDQSPLTFVTLAPPVQARPLVLAEKPVILASFRAAAPAVDSGPPGGLALRI